VLLRCVQIRRRNCVAPKRSKSDGPYLRRREGISFCIYVTTTAIISPLNPPPNTLYRIRTISYDLFFIIVSFSFLASPPPPPPPDLTVRLGLYVIGPAEDCPAPALSPSIRYPVSLDSSDHKHGGVGACVWVAEGCAGGGEGEQGRGCVRE